MCFCVCIPILFNDHVLIILNYLAVVPVISFPDQAMFTYTVNESNSVTFSCRAAGIPPPEISWTRNGTEFSSVTDPRVTLYDPEVTPPGDMNNTTYEITRTLTLNTTVVADSGTYTCIADNQNAREPIIMQDFELLVQGT